METVYSTVFTTADKTVYSIFFTINVITIVVDSCYNCRKNTLFNSRSSVAKAIYLAIVTSFTKMVYSTIVTMQGPVALMCCAALLILSLFPKKGKVCLLISSFHLNQ